MMRARGPGACVLLFFLSFFLLLSSGRIASLAGWWALAWGVPGRALPVPADVAGDAIRATTGRFPDPLLARIASQSAAGLMAALLALAGGTGVAGVCAARLMRRHADAIGQAVPTGQVVPTGGAHDG